MRLWTFQSKDSVKVLEDGVWYALETESRRIKKCDRQYVYEINQNGSTVEVVPIYCFARIPCNFSKYLSVKTWMSENYRIPSYYRMNLTEQCLIELEVPESCVLNMKDADNWYTETNLLWQTIPIVYGDYVPYLHDTKNEGYTIEALISAIKKDWVAAIHEFEYVDSVQRCTTIFTNDSLIPSFTGEIYVAGDGYPRVLEDGKIVSKSLNYYGVIQAERGMDGFMPYMTIRDCLDSCNAKSLAIVKELVIKYGILKEQYSSMYIGELLLKEQSASKIGENFVEFEDKERCVHYEN